MLSIRSPNTDFCWNHLIFSLLLHRQNITQQHCQRIQDWAEHVPSHGLHLDNRPPLYGMVSWYRWGQEGFWRFGESSSSTYTGYPNLVCICFRQSFILGFCLMRYSSADQEHLVNMTMMMSPFLTEMYLATRSHTFLTLWPDCYYALDIWLHFKSIEKYKVP